MTRQAALPAIKAAMAIAETVREVGEAPAGPLYAALMTSGWNLTQFDALVRTLVNAGLVERPNPNTNSDVIRWIGPRMDKIGGAL